MVLGALYRPIVVVSSTGTVVRPMSNVAASKLCHWMTPESRGCHLSRLLTSDASVVPLRHMLRRQFTGHGTSGGINASTQLPEGQGTNVVAVLAGGRSAFRSRARSRDRFHASQSSEPSSAE